MNTPTRDNPNGGKPVIVKKYANRRLYNTATSSYVTLDDLAKMIKEGGDFVAVLLDELADTGYCLLCAFLCLDIPGGIE